MIDSNWLSDDIGWVLGGTGCENTPCKPVIKATSNGGRTWTTRGTPDALAVTPPSLGGCENPCISGIRFADRSVGYAFGASFYVTRDGARTWQRENALPVLSVEISKGRAYRVVAESGGCPGPCDSRVETSAVGSRTWASVPAPSINAAGPVVLTIGGNTIYLAAFGNPAGGAGTAQARLWRSSDEGKTWRSVPDPCGFGPHGENDALRLSAAPNGYLAVLCLSRASDDLAMFVVTSHNSGTTNGPRRRLPTGSAEAIAAASARVMAVFIWRDSRFIVVVSRDGGRTWREKINTQGHEGTLGPVVLGFQDERTARAAFDGGAIWTTRDSGATWSRSDPF